MNFLNNFGKFLKNYHVLRAAITPRNYKGVPTSFLLPHRNENVYAKALKECQRARETMKEIAQLYSRPPRYFIDPYLRRFSCDKGDWCQGYICKDNSDNPCICPPKKKDDACKKKEDKKKDDPCKKKKDKKKDDPCKKKEDPCKKKKDDPCKKKEKKEKKDDPCKKKEDKKKDDPCKKKEKKDKKKDDPCKKKEDKKKGDPCKKKEDPCKKKEDKGKDDPCKKFKKNDKSKKCQSESAEAKAIKEPSSEAAAVEPKSTESGWDIFQELHLLDSSKLSLAEEYCKGHYANTTYLAHHQHTYNNIITHLADSRLPQPSAKPKRVKDEETV